MPGLALMSRRRAKGMGGGGGARAGAVEGSRSGDLSSLLRCTHAFCLFSPWFIG